MTKMHGAATCAYRPSWRRSMVVCAAAGAGTAVAAVVVRQHHKPSNGTHHQFRAQLPQPFVDGLAGAVGEVSQICLLYPLETIKVRCQADSISASQVVRTMVAKYGWSTQLLQHTYSGFASAAAFSLVVGAVHWLSFCAAKRAALDVLPSNSRPKQPAQVQDTAAPLSFAAATSSLTAITAHKHDGHQQLSGASQHVVGQQQHAALDSAQQRSIAMVHVTSSHHTHDEEVCVQGQGHAGEEELSNKAQANAVAAVVGAVCTALVESPVELFRHQAQAGLISGRLMHEMGRAVRHGGPFAPWQGFLPFCLEAFPYDMSELGVYSQLRDVYDSMSKPGSRFHAVCSALPEHVWDLAIGGAAGGAGVLISMPFDCVKTYMQTHSMPGMGSLGVAGQAMLFMRTGMNMVRRRGLGALYVGVLPRLAQQVPSSTVCWWAVNQTQKLLAPYIKQDSKSPGVQH